MSEGPLVRVLVGLERRVVPEASEGEVGARVIQLQNPLKLPPKVLGLLADSGDAPWSERRLRGVLALPSQEDQIAAFEKVRERGA